MLSKELKYEIAIAVFKAVEKQKGNYISGIEIMETVINHMRKTGVEITPQIMFDDFKRSLDRRCIEKRFRNIPKELIIEKYRDLPEMYTQYQYRYTT